MGILSLFVWPAPMTLKQGYLTCTGVIVAYVFTWVPQWTTWTLLAAMAIYDLFAVLSPGGPLKVSCLPIALPMHMLLSSSTNVCIGVVGPLAC